MKRFSIAVLAIILFCLFVSPVRGEEQRDLREGITGQIPSETQWGLLPRFKFNPDTGFGTGLKLKGLNVFGTSMLLDLANIYTSNQFQTYEFLFMLPRLGGDGDKYHYLMLYVQYDFIPDLRFFGIGNTTRNKMFDTGDADVGDESSFSYENVQVRLTAGRSLGNNLYMAFEPFFREVWLDDGAEDKIPNGPDVYGNLPGGLGVMTPGLGLSLVYSTRNDQWRPTEGARAEVRIEDTRSYMGSEVNFTRYIGDLRYYLPLSSAYRVIAFRLRGETLEGENDELPWWEMPAMGGQNTMRGYWEGRFHGKTMLLFNSEFRYQIYHIERDVGPIHVDYIIDGNVFADVGQVFANERKLGIGNNLSLRSTYGFGFRFTTPPNLMGRADIGFSSEQKFAAYFNFGTVF